MSHQHLHNHHHQAGLQSSSFDKLYRRPGQDDDSDNGMLAPEANPTTSALAAASFNRSLTSIESKGDSIITKATAATIDTASSALSGGGGGTSPAVASASIDTPTSSSTMKLYWGLLRKGTLYGRQEEMKKLQDVVERRLQSNAKPELILVTGESGTGKTSLIKKSFFTRPNSVNFMYGKFDHLKRFAPYAPFIQAVTSYIDKIIYKGPEAVLSLKRAIEREIQNDMDGGTAPITQHLQALSVSVPILRTILVDQQQDNDSYKSSEFMSTPSTKSRIWLQKASQNHLHIDFQRLFRALCSPEYPLILVVDDLQWADSSSLDLMQLLASDGKNHGFAIVGACNSNNIDDTNPSLSKMLHRLRDEYHTPVNKIAIHGLSVDATNTLVADVLQQSRDYCSALSENFYRPSKGNPYFIIQLLHAVWDFSILLPHPDDPSWLWDDDAGTEFVDGSMDILSLLRKQILRLPSESQSLLRICACIGFEVNSKLLSKGMDGTIIFSEDILPIVAAGFMVNVEDRPNIYTFTHDCVHEAAYSLISEKEKNATHLMIGRMLVRNLKPKVVEDNIFLVVNQMSRGMAHLRDQEERTYLAELCLKAGRKAVMSCDRHTATMHYLLGTTLISNGAWQSNYSLSLDLFSSMAEAESLVDGSDMMDYAIGEVLKNARSFGDKVRVYSIQVQYLGSRSRSHEAIDLCIKILQDQGESIDSKGKNGWVMDKSPQSKTKKLLKQKKNSDILCLPDDRNSDRLAKMDILNLLAKYALISQPDLLPAISYRIIKLSLEHGICPTTAIGFALYAIYTIGGSSLTSSSDYDNEYGYGKLAISILDRCNRKGDMITEEFRPRLFGLFYGWIAHWKDSIRSTLPPLLLAQRQGIEAGDIAYSMMFSYMYSINAFSSGLPLNQVEAFIMRHLDLLNNGKWNYMTLQMIELIQALSNGDTSEKDESEHLTSGANGESTIWKLIQAYHFGDYENALNLATECRENMDVVSKSSFLIIILHFFDALTCLACACCTQQSRNAYLLRARKGIQALKDIANEGNQSSSQNCLPKICLLDAEFCASNGSISRAVRKYKTSIAMADEHGSIQDQAIACERAYYVLSQHGEKSNARPFLESAIELYNEWGAKAKADLLQKNLKDFVSQRHAHFQI